MTVTRLGFSPVELSKSLRVGRDKIMRWIRSGELPAANVGTPERPSYRVAASTLAEFMERRAAKPTPKRQATRPVTKPTREEWY